MSPQRSGPPICWVSPRPSGGGIRWTDRYDGLPLFMPQWVPRARDGTDGRATGPELCTKPIQQEYRS